jgi:uncharacterized protein
MKVRIMSQAQDLYALQQIDLEEMQHEKRLEALTAELADNDAVQTAQQAVTTAKDALKPLRVQSRDLELELQTNAEKTKSTEDRLYSGNVKDPKEMRDMQQEISTLKKRNDTLEDRLLDLMVQVEDAETTLTQAEEALQTALDETESQHGDLIAEQKQIRARLQDLQTARDQQREKIKAQNLQIYDKMKPRKGNRPIALLRGRSCSACGVQQTLAIETAVKRQSDLVACESCGRILALG